MVGGSSVAVAGPLSAAKHSTARSTPSSPCLTARPARSPSCTAAVNSRCTGQVWQTSKRVASRGPAITCAWRAPQRRTAPRSRLLSSTRDRSHSTIRSAHVYLICRRRGRQSPCASCSTTRALPDFTKHPDFIARVQGAPQEPLPPAKLVEFIANEDLEFQPGSRFQYSNSDNVVVGLMVRAVTGMTYREALQTYVYEPIELTAPCRSSFVCNRRSSMATTWSHRPLRKMSARSLPRRCLGRPVA